MLKEWMIEEKKSILGILYTKLKLPDLDFVRFLTTLLTHC